MKDGFCGMTIKGRHYEEKAHRRRTGCWQPARSCPRPERWKSAVTAASRWSFPSAPFTTSSRLPSRASPPTMCFWAPDAGATSPGWTMLWTLPGADRESRELPWYSNQQRDAAQAELGKPFPQEEELAAKSARLAELDALLNMEDSPGQEAPVEGKTEAKEESRKPSVLAELKVAAASKPSVTKSKTCEKEAETRQ